jgi:hypothetical protein
MVTSLRMCAFKPSPASFLGSGFPRAGVNREPWSPGL